MYGVRTAEAMLATTLLNQIRMAEMFAKIISEHAGILCAAAVFSFGRITGQVMGHKEVCTMPMALCISRLFNLLRSTVLSDTLTADSYLSQR